MKFKYILLALMAWAVAHTAKAQIVLGGQLDTINYADPVIYEIGGIRVVGTQFYDPGIVTMLTGILVGDKIQVPGEKLSVAIENLWKQGLFGDVRLLAEKVEGNKLFLIIQVEEKPRIARFVMKGIRKGEQDNLKDKVRIIGKVANEDLINTTQASIKEVFRDKGFFDTDVTFTTKPDSLDKSKVTAIITVRKGSKIKINQINFIGNSVISDARLRRSMKDTKEKRWFSLFTSSKFIPENLPKEREKIIALYNAKGFRDATIIKDTVYRYDGKTLNIDIVIDEGKKYYFRNISWVGNTLYKSDTLSRVLGIKKGDIYNQEVLERNLFMNPNGTDVSSLYMDNGYLFFNVQPIEVAVDGDSIDFEMRIYEGKPAIINKVTVVGNTKTSDYVILRELRTKPGQLFRRSDIVLTQRELSQLGYFDPEQIQVNPIPNPADGTVDIEYVVVEKPSDQLQLQGGWGFGRLVGTLGVTLNNFSTRRMFKKGAWRPIPGGDGQRLSVSAQTNGPFFQAYNLSFTEPWLGGKKPNSLTVSLSHNVISQAGTPIQAPLNRGVLRTSGFTVGFGTRWKRPDNYFNAFYSFNLQNYFTNIQGNANGLTSVGFATGNNLSTNFGINITRNSVDQPIYPREGSNFSFSLNFTPPWSYIQDGFKRVEYSADKPYSSRLIEFHKWKINYQWYQSIVGKLVLNARAHAGYLGNYNSSIGSTAFERFSMGGVQIAAWNFVGTEIIPLRGYPASSLASFNLTQNPRPAEGFYRYVAELRYPVSLNQQATIFGLAFAEAGNIFRNMRDFNPFNVRRSVGAGVRVFLPMFGLLGVDYGYGLDPLSGTQRQGEVHFIFGANID